MKRNLLLAAMTLAAGSLLAADPKDDVMNAAKKLTDAGNYSWKQTTENAGGGGGGFGGRGGGPSEGKTKDGLVYTSSTFGDTTIERVTKGTNSAMNRGEGWQTAAEMAANAGGGGGGRRGGFGFNQAIQTPTSRVEDVLKAIKDLKEQGGAYVGDFTEDGAKTLLTPNFGGRRGGAGGGGGGGFTIAVTDAKGSAMFWVKDGVLAKYQLKLQGKMAFGDNDPMDINTTTTVEIKDVGNTKINVPADVVGKLN